MRTEKSFKTAQSYIEKVKEQAKEIADLQELLNEKRASVEKTLAKLRSYKKRGIVKKISTYDYVLIKETRQEEKLESLLNELKKQADLEKYTSWQGKTCYRTFGNLGWYLLKCSEFDLTPKRVDDFSYTAKGTNFSFDYVEHDIILAIE